jgi:uncharacterized membrane protein YraQ (UPF0718 family)
LWAVLLGLVLGGVIDYFVPDGFIMRFLGQTHSAVAASGYGAADPVTRISL